MRIGFFIALLSVVGSFGALHSANEVNQGEVEILVRGPDGKPAANAEVHVIAARWDLIDQRPEKLTGKTDRDGLVRFPWMPGIGRMRVSVPGVGYGATGVFEVVSRQCPRAPLAPLAPFAVVEGTIPVKLRGAKSKIVMRTPDRFPQQPVSASVGADGFFRCEVTSGRWEGHLEEDNVPKEYFGPGLLVPGQRVSIRVAGKETCEEKPSEEKEGKESQPASAPAARQTIQFAQQPPPPIPFGQPGQSPPPEQMTWAAGTVRDQAGKPVAGATVWALATYHGGIRTYEDLATATTDAKGKYELKGQKGLRMFSASIVAHIPGRPPTWAWILEPGGPTLDLVLPDRGGRLDVTVLRDGKPAAGVRVGVWLNGTNLRDRWAWDSGFPERIKLVEVVHPVVVSDALGVAHFDHLLPGRYKVIAANVEDQLVRSLHEHHWMAPASVPYGIDYDIPVTTGSSTTHQMAIYEQPLVAQVRVLKPDGNGVAIENVDFEVYNASSRKLDNGIAELTFLSAGLQNINLRYRDSPLLSRPLRGEPYSAAKGVVATSRLLSPKTNTTTLTARRFDPGTIVVELKDLAGKPARGVIEILMGRDLELSGSTDGKGIVRFEGVPSGQYEVRGYIAGWKPINLYEGGDVLGPITPAEIRKEEALRGATVIMPVEIKVEANQERAIKIQEEKVGYILGRLKPPEGRATEYGVYANGERLDPRETGRQLYLPYTGEFVMGPFAAGKVKLVTHGPTKTVPNPLEVTIAGGEVTRVEVTPTEEVVSPVAELDPLLAGLGDLRGLPTKGAEEDPLVVNVMLPGGKEPALGAMVLEFESNWSQPINSGLTDATGKVRARSLLYTIRSTPVPANDPPGKLLVALLPGKHGGVVVAPKRGKPLTIELPPAVSLRGRVMVGGADPSRLPARISVLATLEGKGRLNDTLSVQTTAQADGSFELAGLTPGRNRVQAALDGIWLSPTTVLEVTDKPLADLTLAIPKPGGPVLVKVVGPDDKPLPGRTVTVERPAGPLTSTLWPTNFITDGAGTVTIPALEEGKRIIKLTGADVSAEVAVPHLPVDHPVEVRLRDTR